MLILGQKAGAAKSAIGSDLYKNNISNDFLKAAGAFSADWVFGLRLYDGSRMKGDFHDRFCESPRGRIPRATLPYWGGFCQAPGTLRQTASATGRPARSLLDVIAGRKVQHVAVEKCNT